MTSFISINIVEHKCGTCMCQKGSWSQHACRKLVTIISWVIAAPITSLNVCQLSKKSTSSNNFSIKSYDFHVSPVSPYFMSHVELGTSIISRPVLEGKAPDMPSLQSKNPFFPCKNHIKKYKCYAMWTFAFCIAWSSKYLGRKLHGLIIFRSMTA